jgi:hypothetical protein
VTWPRATRRISLPLPRPDLAIRLLRSPFAPAASRARVRQHVGRPSLQQPPRFGTDGSWIAVPQLDGGIIAYKVPRSIKGKPGKTRTLPPAAGGSYITAGVFGKNLAALRSQGETLILSGYPSEVFAKGAMVTQRPPPDQFRAPPQSGRWLQSAFSQRSGPVLAGIGEPRLPFDLKGRQLDTWIHLVDLDRQLVRWNCRATHNAGVFTVHPAKHSVRADNVIGLAQAGNEVFYAFQEGTSTRIAALVDDSVDVLETHLPGPASRALFGNMLAWRNRRALGLVALDLQGGRWWLGLESQAARVMVEEKAKVIGVAASALHRTHGLLVLTADKLRIELRTGDARPALVLVRSAEPIAQACVNPVNGDLAWIGSRSLALTVQGIDQEKPFLRVTVEENDHDE